MRKLCILGAVLLVLTACSSTPSPVTGDFDVAVVFDGEACVYDGPGLVAADSTMTLEFDEGEKPAAVWVGHALEGTELEEIIEYFENNSWESVPPFAADPYPRVRARSGTLVVHFNEAGTYAVGCSTAPEDTNKAFPAAMIEVVEA